MKSQHYRPDPQDAFGFGYDPNPEITEMDNYLFQLWLDEQNTEACPLNDEEFFNDD